MKGKYKCIYNLRLAGYLMLHGFPIKRVEKNLDRPWRDVYLFEVNDEIEEAIEFYKFKKSKEKIDYDNNRKGKCKTE